MKISSPLLQGLLLSIAVFGLPSSQLSISAKIKASQQSSLITSSSLLEDVQRKLQEEPNIPLEKLAEYANRLLAEKGLNYDFEVCEAIGPKRFKKTPDTLSQISYSYPMRQTDGHLINLQFVSTNPADGLCGECFSSIPAQRVIKSEMEILSNGQRLRLKRPLSFNLDQAELVDQSMKTVSRTWQLPYQTAPVGISEDGMRLFIPLESGPEALILELSEDGRVQFRARTAVALQGEGETIENAPRDRKNAYLGFKRFKAGGRTYIVKFSWPCT
jgi:hypothetical protein